MGPNIHSFIVYSKKTLVTFLYCHPTLTSSVANCYKVILNEKYFFLFYQL